MSDLSRQIAANLEALQRRIEAACERSARSPDTVQLVAVTKYARPEWVSELVNLGLVTLGESRPQQLVERALSFPENVRWHLIGHLQRNKVRVTLPAVELIHSVDSLRLARRISQLAGELALRPRVLLEVNVSGEAAKDGFAISQLRDTWSELCQLPHLRIDGLMTMAPAAELSESARPVFRALRLLRDELQEMEPVQKLPELSMGMSGDFEVAIEEGATLVRIGSALFQGLE